MSLDNYTASELLDFIDHNSPPPSPLERQQIQIQIREAVEDAVRQALEAQSRGPKFEVKEMYSATVRHPYPKSVLFQHERDAEKFIWLKRGDGSNYKLEVVPVLVVDGTQHYRLEKLDHHTSLNGALDTRLLKLYQYYKKAFTDV